MNNAQPFDPYDRWLGIPPEQQPADYYQLLGVQRFLQRKSSLEIAYDQRMTYLHTKRTGPHGAYAEQLKNEITKAFQVLNDDQQRAAYDANLMAKTRVAVAVAVPVKTAVVPEPPAYPPAIQSDKPLPIDSNAHLIGLLPSFFHTFILSEFTTKLIVVLLAAIAAMATTGGLLYFIIYRSQPSPNTAQTSVAENSSPASPEGTSESSKTTEPPVAPTVVTPTPEPEQKPEAKPAAPEVTIEPVKLPAEMKPLETAPVATIVPEPKPTRVPAISTTPKPPRREQDPFAALPARLQLPAVASSSSVQLGRLEFETPPLVLMEILGGDTASKSPNYSFTLQLEKSLHWNVLLNHRTDEPKQIAELRLVNHQLHFAWSPKATDSPVAANFCNCVLRLSAGQYMRQVPLRTVTVVPPLVLEFDKVNNLRVEIEHLPDPKHVRIELIATAKNGFPRVQMVPEPDIKLSSDDSYLWCDVAAASAGEAVSPPEELLASNPQYFLGLQANTTLNTKGIELRLAARVRQSETTQDTAFQARAFASGVAALQQQLFLLQTNLSRSTNDPALIRRLSRGEREQLLAGLEQKMAETSNALEKVKNINRTVEKMHGKATLHLRVVHHLGNEKITLAETEGLPVENQVDDKDNAKALAP